MKTVIISENQNGLLYNNGKYIKTVGAGKYRLFGGRTMEIFEQGQVIDSKYCPLDTLLADANFAKRVSTVEVGDEVSPNADFGVRIAGDSMEPRFVHGQIVWVHRQETLRSGEIGVFLYNGAGYCKRFERAPGRVELVSLNLRYAPIRVAEGDELRVFGRVVG